MEIDWDLVKKQTLWHYEKLVAKLLDVLDYNFVREHYGHDMAAAGAYAGKIQQGYLQNGVEAGFITEIMQHFYVLNLLGITSYHDLVMRVATKPDCERFLRETGFGFEALIGVLNYLFRWVLPFKIPVKELLDITPGSDDAVREVLKTQKIRSNLDVLESFRLKEDRKIFVDETGVDPAFLLGLTHRADLSRLAYVRGKTIMHLCGGGYCTLHELAIADIGQMKSDMTAYYGSLGKTFADFKTVIPLDWMVGGSRVLPKIIQEE